MAAFYFYRHFKENPIGRNEITAFQKVINAYFHEWKFHEASQAFAGGMVNYHFAQKDLSLQGFKLQGLRSSYFLVGDIRLDNRIQLRELLECPDSDDRDLVIKAYEAFGASFAKYLTGDFGFVLHDLKSNETIMVRDHLGVIPIYYHLCESFLLVSDSIDVLLAHPSIKHKLNDKVVQEFLTWGCTYNQKETFYTDIAKLSRATVATCNKGVLESTVYWHPETIKPIQYDTEEEYVTHLTQLLERAVLDRLPSNVTIGAHLSSGMDSSPIAVMAGRNVINSGKVFYTYNWCSPEPKDDHSSCHEWSDAREIAEIEKFTHEEINYTVEEAKKNFKEHDISRHGSTMFLYERILLPLAQEQGVHVLFAGFGGDEFLTTRSRSRYVNLIKKGRWFKAFRNIITQTKINDPLRFLRAIKYFSKSLYYSLLPVRLLPCGWCDVKKRKLNATKRIISDAFRESLPSDLRHNTIPASGSIRERQLFYLNLGYHQERMESWNSLGKRYGIRYVYPLLDKRVVEFALALPESLYYKHGLSRYIYRKAILPFLPKHLIEKQKLSEKYRLRHLQRTDINALKGWDFTKSSSPYVNMDALQYEYAKLQAVFEGSDINQQISLATLRNAILVNQMVQKNQ